MINSIRIELMREMMLVNANRKNDFEAMLKLKDCKEATSSDEVFLLNKRRTKDT